MNMDEGKRRRREPPAQEPQTNESAAGLEAALKGATRLYRQGQLEQAKEACGNILRAAPEHFRTLYLLGAVATRLGDSALAANSFAKAAAADPANTAALVNLGIARKNLGKPDAAIASYRRALEIDPNFAEAHNALGKALQDRNRTLKDPEMAEEALACFRRAVELKPDFAEAHHNLGRELANQENLDEAAACYRRALELDPALADAHNSLGNVLRHQKKLKEAAACYRRVIGINPNLATAHNNLGKALMGLDRLDKAAASCRRALEIDPEHLGAHGTLADILYEQAELEEAEAGYRRALEIEPDNAGTLHSLGNTLRLLGNVDEAIALYRRAIEIRPDFGNAHFHLGLALLSAGDLDRGWEEHEWRWKRETEQKKKRREFAQPMWDGSRLDGRTILLHAEQGLGDTIHFIRYAPMVAQRGGRVVVECRRLLLRLFRDMEGIDQLVRKGRDLPPFDVQASLMSLPMIFGTTLETIPGDVGYIRAEGRLVEAWKDRLSGLAGRKVGLCWQGNPKFPRDKWRSIPLKYFAGLLDDPSSTFVNLHKGSGEGQIGECGLGDRIVNYSAEVKSLADTAAIIENLDLVITSDTSVAHLAGAIGKPVWILLQFAADWRWLLEREDSPWYPTMRLFRQTTRGDWRDVLARVKSALDACPAP
ncbi:MAG: tetratricopeptide repeat protein [Rhodospirillales bacterium]